MVNLFIVDDGVLVVVYDIDDGVVVVVVNEVEDGFC